VNFVLGKGLHSYGFGIGGESYVAAFVIIDLAFVAFTVGRYRAMSPVPQPVAPVKIAIEHANVPS
jgi:hypothetical protein